MQDQLGGFLRVRSCWLRETGSGEGGEKRMILDVFGNQSQQDLQMDWIWSVRERKVSRMPQERTS